jgi:hypothetical protein
MKRGAISFLLKLTLIGVLLIIGTSMGQAKDSSWLRSKKINIQTSTDSSTKPETYPSASEYAKRKGLIVSSSSLQYLWRSSQFRKRNTRYQNRALPVIRFSKGKLLCRFDEVYSTPGSRKKESSGDDFLYGCFIESSDGSIDLARNYASLALDKIDGKLTVSGLIKFNEEIFTISHPVSFEKTKRVYFVQANTSNIEINCETSNGHSKRYSKKQKKYPIKKVAIGNTSEAKGIDGEQTFLEGESGEISLPKVIRKAEVIIHTDQNLLNQFDGHTLNMNLYIRNLVAQASMVTVRDFGVALRVRDIIHQEGLDFFKGDSIKVKKYDFQSYWYGEGWVYASVVRDNPHDYRVIEGRGRRQSDQGEMLYVEDMRLGAGDLAHRHFRDGLAMAMLVTGQDDIVGGESSAPVVLGINDFETQFGRADLAYAAIAVHPGAGFENELRPREIEESAIVDLREGHRQDIYLQEITLFLHEMGHNIGAHHSHCYHLDACGSRGDNSNICHELPPEQGVGVLMSYCSDILLENGAHINNGIRGAINAMPEERLNLALPIMQVQPLRMHHFVVDQGDIRRGDEVEFRAGVFNPNGGRLFYIWELGPGNRNLFINRESRMIHSYRDVFGRDFQARVTVVDDFFNWVSSHIIPIHVTNNTLPEVHFSDQVGDQVDQGQEFTLQLVVVDIDQDEMNITIDYGDGNQEVLVSGGYGSFPLVHRYQEAGRYRIAVSVRDARGLKVINRHITVE